MSHTNIPQPTIGSDFINLISHFIIQSSHESYSNLPSQLLHIQWITWRWLSPGQWRGWSLSSDPNSWESHWRTHGQRRRCWVMGEPGEPGDPPTTSATSMLERYSGYHVGDSIVRSPTSGSLLGDLNYHGYLPLSGMILQVSIMSISHLILELLLIRMLLLMLVQWSYFVFVLWRSKTSTCEYECLTVINLELQWLNFSQQLPCRQE